MRLLKRFKRPFLVGKRKEGHRPLRREFYEKRFNLSLRNWLIHHQNEIVFTQVKWMGVPAYKNVLDAWIYQEILFEVQPDVLIEIGSMYGGSTRYFADLFDLIGSGLVVSIDNDRSLYCVKHPRIKELTGNSNDPKILSMVSTLCEDKKVLVIQDADHRKEVAFEDLQNYSKFVSVGSYLIVEDGIVDLFHHGDGLGFEEDGPLAATEEFLKHNPSFEVDFNRERYMLTYNPKGFLKRIS